jgi:UDPglucose--hexose-1-phosphate uridylyltransferase
MNKVGGRLADGREILYFDDEDRGRVPSPDRRSLPALESSIELRYDPMAADWVIIASHRQDRTYLPPAGECPLCPSRPERPTEIPDSDYDVVVFENRFPSLSGAVPAPEEGDGPFPSAPGSGRCEVVCFTSDHDGSFGELAADRLATIAQVLVDRTAALSAIEGVQYVLPFENRGEEIGVTLSHPHGQIYAYPFVPPRLARQLAVLRRHRDQSGDCLICRQLTAELGAGERVVGESEAAVAYVPFAARWPLQVNIVARRHLPDLESLEPQARLELLGLQARVLAALDRLFPASPVPYIAALVQAPVRANRDIAHLRVEVVSPRRAAGKLKYLAGSETAGGAFINDIRPERAAAMIREAMSERSPAGG